MADATQWLDGIEGNFPIHKAVVDAMPTGTKVIASESSGISSWTKTAKVSVITPRGNPASYFLKCVTGQSARALAEGEHHSATNVNKVVPGFGPKAIGWGEYEDQRTTTYFFLSTFHEMDFSSPPEPEEIMPVVAELHSRGTSPNGMFGYPVPVVCGRLQRTTTWTSSWAESFTFQLKDVIKYDNDANGPWPEYDVVCKQLIDAVIPRLLGALQSEGRDIKPTLIHGNLWERNVGRDTETGEILIFDPGCTYAHNEMEFGTWRCTWAFYFNLPTYIGMYQRYIKPSEPVDEWDDRNRLYSIHPYLNDSAGHPGSRSRQIAYNDMLYLIEKYAPLKGTQKYDPEKDIGITGAYTHFEINQLQ